MSKCVCYWYMFRGYVFGCMSKGGISKGVCRIFRLCPSVSVLGYVHVVYLWVYVQRGMSQGNMYLALVYVQGVCP